METIFDFTKNVLEAVQQFESEDNEIFEEYKSELAAVLNAFKPPPEKTARTKKQKISLHNEVEVDSGMDATTATSSTGTESNQGSTRPSRSAKTKASGNLKLPNLGTKLRREIKLEPISEDAPKLASSTTSVTQAKENDLNSLNVKREKLSDVVRSQANSSGETDSSVMVIANEEQIFTLSDDDNDGDDEIMPPPLKPAPKKLVAKKTRQNPKNIEVINGTENDGEGSSLSHKSLKLEKLSTETKNLKAKKTKAKKTNKILRPFVEVKEEIVDVVERNEASSQEQSSQNSQNDNQDTNENQVSANVTIESVYEDANDKIIKPSQPTNMLPACSTYVCQPAPSLAVDETFVSTHSALSVGSQLEANHAVTIPAAKPGAKTSHSSLITEDDSDEEIASVAVQRKLQNNKELFNPCIQSPMQMKVAAFERQNELLSPTLIRQTRTKTRQLAKENADNGATKMPKSATPTVESKFNNTPLGKTLLPPKIHSQNILRTQSSVSQATNFNRPNSAQPLKNRSRDNSVEDLARGREVRQAILEKKRKGEERVKRAQLLRETQEREKQEKYLKALQEKQEKEEARKLLREQQEMQRQQKAQEQKRERELRLKAELAKAAKQDRENMLSKKILAEKEHLNNLKQSKKDEIKSKYTFDMLLTDDSTDDEDKVDNSRPAPPAWSLRANRKDNMISQASIDPNIIDKFFSCQPTTPDLAAIFPQIDSKYLKRNSSAVWNTPPRYSQLPKY